MASEHTYCKGCGYVLRDVAPGKLHGCPECGKLSLSGVVLDEPPPEPHDVWEKLASALNTGSGLLIIMSSSRPADGSWLREALEVADGE